MGNESQVNNISENERKIELIKNKCQSCGADLVFDVESNCLKCEHCGSKFYVEEINTSNKKPFNPLKTVREKIERSTIVSKCVNCGAQETYDTHNISHPCPFCGYAKVIKTTSGQYQPQSIVPFSVKKEDITPIFKKWVKKKKFVPNKFRNVDVLRSIKPTYFPNWLFDATTYTEYDGVLLYEEQRTRTGRDGRTETYTVTERRRVSGKRTDYFSDIVIPSGDIDAITYSKIAPFNLRGIKAYSPEYLAGYYANQYSIDLDTSWRLARDITIETIKSNIVRAHHADGYERLNLNPTYSKTQYSYTFLPCWVCSYMYEEKNYNVYINGTNGRVYGKAPVSKAKVLALILGILFAVTALIIFIYFSGANAGV